MVTRTPINGPHQPLTPPDGPNLSQRVMQVDQDVTQFFTGVTQRILGLNTNTETQRRMHNEQLWLQAFLEPGMLTNVQVSTARPQHPFGPKEYLENLSLEERTLEFIRFARMVIPRNVRTTHPLMQNVRALIDDDLNAVMVAHGRPAILQEFNAANIQPVLLQSMAMIMGEGDARSPVSPTVGQTAALGTSPLVPGIMPSLGLSAVSQAASQAVAQVQGQADAQDIARQSLAELYGPNRYGHLYADYTNTVRDMRNVPNGPQPSPEQLTNVEFLLKTMPAGRLRGYLLMTGREEAQKSINEVAERLQKSDQDQQQMHDVMHQDLSRMDLQTRRNAERQQRTLVDNFRSMDPLQQVLVGALGAYVLYRMWKSDWKIVNAIPVTIVGTYLYLRLMKGDQNAMNTMGEFVRGGVNSGWDAASSAFPRLMGMPEDQRDMMFRQLSVFSRFFNERAFESLYPVSSACVVMASMKLRSLSLAMKPTQDGQGWLFDPESPDFKTEFEGIIRRQGLDANAVRRYFTDRANHPRIQRALASFFYVLSADKPQHADLRRRIEFARRKAATRQNPSPAFDQLQGEDQQDTRYLRNQYIFLANDGMQTARTDSRLAGKTMGDAVRALVEAPTSGPQVDGAGRIQDISTLPTHRAEFGLYGSNSSQLDNANVNNTPALGTAIANERIRTLDAAKADYEEFLENMTVHQRLLTQEARTMLQLRFEGIRTMNGLSVRDRLIQIEKMKYAVLLACQSAQSLPLTLDAANGLGLPDPLQPQSRSIGDQLSSVLDRLWGFVNTEIVTLSARLGNVNTMADIEAILQAERFVTFGGPATPDGRGFTPLRNEATRYKQIFEDMRVTGTRTVVSTGSNVGLAGGNQNIEAMARRMISDTSLGLQNRGITEQQLATMLRGVRSGNQYQESIDRMERYFAQRCANTIVMAMLTTHRVSGQHTLSELLAQRAITPTEIQNLMDAWRRMFREIVGEDGRVDTLRGFWGRLETMEQVQERTLFGSDQQSQSAIDINLAALRDRDVQDPDTGRDSINDACAIARFYLSQFSRLSNEQKAAIRERIVAIAESFERRWFMAPDTRPVTADRANPSRPELLERDQFQASQLGMLKSAMQIVEAGSAVSPLGNNNPRPAHLPSANTLGASIDHIITQRT